MHYEYGDAWFLTEIMSKRSFCVKKHPVFSLFWLIFYDLCSKIASNCPIKIWSFDLCNLPRVAQNVQHLLGIVFTCNDLDLFRWVYSILEELREPDFWSANCYMPRHFWAQVCWRIFGNTSKKVLKSVNFGSCRVIYLWLNSQ